MKKILKIILINIIIIFALLIAIELICCITKKEFLSEPTFKHLKDMMKVQYSFNSEIHDSRYRFIPYLEDETQETKKSPIILMGGSFTNGFGIGDNYTFNAQLKNYTNRDIYNLGINGGGPREILMSLQNENLIKRIHKTPQYIIYTYIPDHKRRLYVPLAFLNANYKPINNYTDLQFYTPIMPIYKSFIYETIMNKLYKNNLIAKEKTEKFFNLYIKKINEEIKKLFGEKTQLVILVYYENEKENWDIIKKEGITVINILEDWNINTQEVRFKGNDQEHPNAKAWETIVPELVKELKPDK